MAMAVTTQSLFLFLPHAHYVNTTPMYGGCEPPFPLNLYGPRHGNCRLSLPQFNVGGPTPISPTQSQFPFALPQHPSRPKHIPFLWPPFGNLSIPFAHSYVPETSSHNGSQPSSTLTTTPWHSRLPTTTPTVCVGYNDDALHLCGLRKATMMTALIVRPYPHQRSCHRAGDETPSK